MAVREHISTRLTAVILATVMKTGLFTGCSAVNK